MINFTSIEVLPCDSKSVFLLPIMFTIYPFKGHCDFNKYLTLPILISYFLEQIVSIILDFTEEILFLEIIFISI